MSIVWAKQTPPAPFEGAEFKLTNTHLATLRSFERLWFFVMSESINIPLRSEAPAGGGRFELSLLFLHL